MKIQFRKILCLIISAVIFTGGVNTAFAMDNTVLLSGSPAKIILPEDEPDMVTHIDTSRIERGTWKNYVYTNEYAELEFKNPENWKIYSDTEVSEKIGVPKKDFSDIKTTIIKEGIVYDMMTVDPVTNSSVIVLYENTFMKTGLIDVTPEAYLNSAASMLFSDEEAGSEYTVKSTGSAEICGNTYATFTVLRTIDGKTMTQSFYARNNNGVMMVIIATLWNNFEDIMSYFVPRDSKGEDIEDVSVQEKTYINTAIKAVVVEDEGPTDAIDEEIEEINSEEAGSAEINNIEVTTTGTEGSAEIKTGREAVSPLPAYAETNEIERGTWNGEVYTNEYAKLKFTNPDNWQNYTEDELCEFPAMPQEELKNVSEAMNEQGTVYDMVTTDKNTGNNVIVLYEKTENEDITAKEYLNSIVTSISEENSGMEYEFGEIGEAKVCGNTYSTVTAKVSAGEDTCEQAFYARNDGGVMIDIIVTAYDGNTVNAIMNNFGN